MKILTTLLLAVVLCLASCGDSFSTYKIEDLYGEWQSDTWAFTFNEDGSCKVSKGGNTFPGETTFSQVPMGNALEFVSNGKVFLSNVTIKGIQNDTLSIEMRPMIGGIKAEASTVITKLARVK